jgi:hypothetical protein
MSGSMKFLLELFDKLIIRKVRKVKVRVRVE